MIQGNFDGCATGSSQWLLLQLFGSKVVAPFTSPVGVLLTERAASVVRGAGQVPVQDAEAVRTKQ